MFAILNWFDDPRLSEVEKVEKGDRVKSVVNDFNLTEDKEYEVIEVNSPTMITIMNDANKFDIIYCRIF